MSFDIDTQGFFQENLAHWPSHLIFFYEGDFQVTGDVLFSLSSLSVRCMRTRTLPVGCPSAWDSADRCSLLIC